MDGEEWGEYLLQFGVRAEDVPCGVVWNERVSGGVGDDAKTGIYYPQVKIERDAISAYLEAIMNGRGEWRR